MWWLPEPDHGASTTQRSSGRQIGRGHCWGGSPARFLIFFPAEIVVDILMTHISVEAFLLELGLDCI